MAKKDKSLVLASKNFDLELATDIVYELATDDNEDNVPTVQWLCDRYDMDSKSALALVSNPKFAMLLHNMQKAIARVQFDRKAYNTIEGIIDKGKDRDKLQAIKLCAELLDYKKDGPQVQVNIKFDRLVRQLETTPQDKEDVIDADYEDISDDYPGL